jgi:16S rRNA (guanine(966)-N(2))-methyltransferase RsmD
MRVIAGTLKGRRLKGPSWDGLRPTSDRLRGTLFNVLAPRIVGARVLDGYAGTGAVGIEALSRGAAHVTFVDDDRRAQRLVADNLAHCGVRNGYVIIPKDLARALSALRADAAFDIILLDPPYDQLTSMRETGGDKEVQAVVAAAGERLAPGGILVLEHVRRIAAPDSAGCLIRTRDLFAGDSGLAFFEVQRH